VTVELGMELSGGTLVQDVQGRPWISSLPHTPKIKKIMSQKGTVQL
jgi:hypothetical protein